MSQQALPSTPPPQNDRGCVHFFSYECLVPQNFFQLKPIKRVFFFFYYNAIFTNFPLHDTHLKYTIEKVSPRSIFCNIISNKTNLN